MKTNKRSDERHLTMGLMSSISDGKQAFMGVVEDISATGLRVSQVPAVFDDKADHCFTVVKGPSNDIHILLRPCWARSTNHGMYKDIGFQIENPPEAWKAFVERMTNESDFFHTLMSPTGMEM